MQVLTSVCSEYIAGEQNGSNKNEPAIYSLLQFLWSTKIIKSTTTMHLQIALQFWRTWIEEPDFSAFIFMSHHQMMSINVRLWKKGAAIWALESNGTLLRFGCRWRAECQRALWICARWRTLNSSSADTIVIGFRGSDAMTRSCRMSNMKGVHAVRIRIGRLLSNGSDSYSWLFSSSSRSDKRCCSWIANSVACKYHQSLYTR